MLAFKPFESWAPGSDWTLGLPQGEEAVAVATGTTFCAAVTSRHCLRIFSISGVPLEASSSPCNSVTHPSCLVHADLDSNDLVISQGCRLHD